MTAKLHWFVLSHHPFQNPTCCFAYVAFASRPENNHYVLYVSFNSADLYPRRFAIISPILHHPSSVKPQTNGWGQASSHLWLEPWILVDLCMGRRNQNNRRNKQRPASKAAQVANFVTLYGSTDTCTCVCVPGFFSTLKPPQDLNESVNKISAVVDFADFHLLLTFFNVVM